MQVYKFGGASLKDAKGFERMAALIQDQSEAPLVLVISALGKTTNALERVIEAYINQDGQAFARLDEVRQTHLSLIEELGLTDAALLASINDILVEAEWLLEDAPIDGYDYIYDQTAAIGELLSSQIFYHLLQKSGRTIEWIDVRDLIKTNDQYRAAEIDWEMSAELIQQRISVEDQKIWVTQGFIASTDDNYSTTLGREGSDYSGAVFAAALSAKSLTIWKDVPGVMSADPKQDDAAVLIPEMSYEAALRIADQGAKVIHPKTIKPLMDRQIPLYVRPFLSPADSGTVIS